jgi:hypothetical protein
VDPGESPDIEVRCEPCFVGCSTCFFGNDKHNLSANPDYWEELTPLFTP